MENKKIIIYGGRFSPFHPGHYGVYSTLIKEFKTSRIYIATANNVSSSGLMKEKNRNPFSFKEKKKIIAGLYPDIKNIIECVQPAFRPSEILNNFDNSFIYIAICGEKSKDKYQCGKYFSPYKNKNMKGYKSNGYYKTIAQQAGGISSSIIRQLIKEEPNPRNKLQRVYGGYYPVFDLMIKKINGTNDTD